MEIQRDYEIKIQRCRELCKEAPDDPNVLGSLITALKSYINSGLIEESVLLIQRKRFHDALMQRMKLTNTDPQYYYEAINNQIELGSADDATAILNQAILRWPNMEETWLLKIKLCYMTHNGDELLKTIAHIKKSKIFLSSDAKQTVEFWSKAI